MPELNSIIIPKPTKKNFRDLEGQIFTHLTVLSYAGTHPSKKQRLWNCRCVCGKIVQVGSTAMLQKRIKSCGCRQFDKSMCAIHGQTYSPTHNSWASMIRRCHGKANEHDTVNYQKRGITVCDRWRFGENGAHPFLCFLADMGERPDELTLERKDNNLGYSPENCEWADRIKQGNNKRGNVILTAFGKTMSAAQWARSLNIHKDTLYSRLASPYWTLEQAVSTPARTKRKHII